MTREEYREGVAKGCRIMGYTSHYLFAYGMCLAFCYEFTDQNITIFARFKKRTKDLRDLLTRSCIKEKIL